MSNKNLYLYNRIYPNKKINFMAIRFVVKEMVLEVGINSNSQKRYFFIKINKIYNKINIFLKNIYFWIIIDNTKKYKIITGPDFKYNCFKNKSGQKLNIIFKKIMPKLRAYFDEEFEKVSI